MVWDHKKYGHLRALALRLLVVGALTGLTFSITSATEPPQTAQAASSASVYWGAYISGAPFNTSLITGFETDAGKSMSIEHWGEAWIRGGAYQEFQSYYMQQVRNVGEIPMITWGSWDSSVGTATQANFTLANVYNGTYDAYVTQWATDAKAWGHPFFLRFDHEMNGNWQFPWSEQINANQPGDYVKAWRHVHDIFSRVGATNVTWVWCPNVSGSTTVPLSQVYPGDNYVDWTCLDGYNTGTSTGDSWQSFAQVYGGSTYGGYNKHDSYKEMLSLAPNKPLMLGEVSSSESGGSKANWITDMFGTQLPNNFPAIKAVVWTNWNDNPKKTWPIESSPAAQAAFKAAIASSYYASNDFGSLGGSVIQPLGTSAPAPAPAPTPAPAPAPVDQAVTSATLTPVADTYTTHSAPTSTAGGSSKTLRADASGTDTAYLRFDLSSLAGKTITSAQVRLHTSTESWAGSSATFDVKLEDSTDWKEQYLSYANSVPTPRTVLGTLTAPKNANTWYTVSLSPSELQAGESKNLVSVAITARSGDVMIFNSRESGSTAPQLILNFK